MEPDAFFQTFVRPAVSDWRANPLSVRHLILALSEFDNLAEHFLLARNPLMQRGDMNTHRDALGKTSAAVVVARDVHDVHKHGALSRRSATMKQGQKPKQALRGGGFDAGFSDGFDIGEPILVVTNDDGSLYFADEVVDELERFWRDELGTGKKPRPIRT